MFSIHNTNLIIFHFLLTPFYVDMIGGKFLDNVKSVLFELYNDYVNEGPSVNETVAPTNTINMTGGIQSTTSVVQLSNKSTSMLKARFKQSKLESGVGGSKKSELESYLSESCIDMEEEGKFNILKWWRLNSERFPVLSKMARDILAIPISTVSSESTFSIGGRVLDAFRSSLTPKLVEALIYIHN